MATTPPSITALPTPPDPNDRSTFNARAYPWSVALNTLGSEANALADNVYDNAVEAVASAAAATDMAALAQNSASASAASAGATAWVSGTTYAAGDARYSPIDFQTYRRKTAGAGTTDPSLDATNWARVVPVVQDYQEFLTSGTWTKPANARFVYLEAIGGGGGGASNIGTSPAGGGSGGEYVSKIFMSDDIADTVSVTVASGGAGALGTGSGSTGGVSSFGGHISALGGNPGNTTLAEFATAPRSLIATGATSTQASAASIPIQQAGHGGATTGYVGRSLYGGAGGGAATTSAKDGGVSTLGGNGGAGSITTVGGNGVHPGGGGGGANGSMAGGSGGAGRVRVWCW